MIFPLFETFLESIYKIFGNEGINCSTNQVSKEFSSCLEFFISFELKI